MPENDLVKVSIFSGCTGVGDVPVTGGAAPYGHGSPARMELRHGGTSRVSLPVGRRGYLTG